MSKTNEGQQDQIEDVVEVTDIVETTDVDGNDNTNWKALAMDRQELARKNHGIAQRYKTKADKARDNILTNPVEKKEPQSNDLGEKSYLISNGIKTKDEIALALRLKKETGKDIESLLETTYFQAELREFREGKATDNATPTASKRSNNSTSDSVDYWLAKDELPPASETKLRQDVVNAKMKKDTLRGIFYNS